MSRAASSSAAADLTPAEAALSEALAWQVTFWSGEASEAERAAFQHWLASDPAHEQVWRRVQRMNGLLGDLPGELGSTLGAKLPARGRRGVLRAIAWLLGGGTLALGVRETPQWQSATADQATTTGERREMVLADGTRLTLNTASAVDVRYDDSQRRLVLLRGEILIDTAADPVSPKRPFLVATPMGEIRALGTRFSVRLEEQAVRTAVFDGAVAIRPAGRGDEAGRLSAGQQAQFDRSGMSTPAAADPLATAWTRGLLVAERLRLADFLAELGRHRRGVLRCDPAVADLIVSGVYPLDDTDRILASLADTLALKLRYITRYWVTVEAA